MVNLLCAFVIFISSGLFKILTFRFNLFLFLYLFIIVFLFFLNTQTFDPLSIAYLFSKC